MLRDLSARPRGSKHLTFLLGDEPYGVDIMKVREICPFEGVVALASVPSYIRGVANLRGDVVPVLDLRVKFGLPVAAISSTTVMIVVSSDDLLVAIVADAVADVLEVDMDQVRPSPDLGSLVDHSYIRGIYMVEGRATILLDPHRLVDPLELEHAASACVEA